MKKFKVYVWSLVKFAIAMGVAYFVNHFVFNDDKLSLTAMFAIMALMEGCMANIRHDQNETNKD